MATELPSPVDTGDGDVVGSWEQPGCAGARRQVGGVGTKAHVQLVQLVDVIV